MKKLVLITGDLASGKSTFGDIAGKKFGVPVFHKDTVKEVLSVTFPFTGRSENLKLSKATMDVLKYIFLSSAKCGNDLILEANYHAEQLNEMFCLAEKEGYSHLVIVLQGDIDILYNRYINRIKNENRHPVHLSTNFDIKENFENYVKNTRLPNINGYVLKLNADTFEYQTDKKTFQIIEKFITGN